MSEEEELRSLIVWCHDHLVYSGLPDRVRSNGIMTFLLNFFELCVIGLILVGSFLHKWALNDFEES